MNFRVLPISLCFECPKALLYRSQFPFVVSPRFPTKFLNSNLRRLLPEFRRGFVIRAHCRLQFFVQSFFSTFTKSKVYFSLSFRMRFIIVRVR
jgi:hypothetical protein